MDIKEIENNGSMREPCKECGRNLPLTNGVCDLCFFTHHPKPTSDVELTLRQKIHYLEVELERERHAKDKLHAKINRLAEYAGHKAGCKYNDALNTCTCGWEKQEDEE